MEIASKYNPAEVEDKWYATTAKAKEPSNMTQTCCKVYGEGR